jgi:hypothetical protein
MGLWPDSSWLSWLGTDIKRKPKTVGCRYDLLSVGSRVSNYNSALRYTGLALVQVKEIVMMKSKRVGMQR